MFRAGQDLAQGRIPGRPNLRYTRAADLITPLVLFGVTFRSVWQWFNGFHYQLLLSRSGVTTFNNQVGAFGPMDAAGVFPYGFDVFPDHP